MTRPTARVLALLELLQGGGSYTAADLAARLDVDERTARRYVEQLVELDVPVWSRRGRYGGYRLAPGYRMPPLMLTDDEAIAVLFGLLASRRAGLATSSVASSEAAAAKVRRVLPERLRRQLDALVSTTDFTDPPQPVASTQADVLLSVAEAARERRPVAFTYTDRRGSGSQRTIHPYGIVAHHGRWYLTGEDPRRGDLRTFRLDRVRSVEVLPGAFAVPDGFDPADRLLAGFAEAPWRYDISIRVHGTIEDVQARLPKGLATVRSYRRGATKEEWVQVRLRAERLDWVPSLLASLDRPFVVEEPTELRQALRTFAERLASYANDTGT